MAEDIQKDIQPDVDPGDSAVQDVSAQQAPAEQAPVQDVPAQDVPAEEPADETPAAEASVETSATMDDSRRRARSRGAISAGIVHIKATFNNTMVSITDMRGGVIAWCNAGRAGFKGSRKSTSFAATLVAQDAARQAVGKGMHEVEVRVQGAGAGRESAIRALQSAGLSISVIQDVTPIPHNGCRARKRRRV